MKEGIDETKRGRQIQEAYHKEHCITPQGIKKAIRDIIERVKVAEKRAAYTFEAPATKDEITRLVKELETQMKAAARALEFEKAALIRDRIIELRRELIIAEQNAIRASK